MKRGLHPLTIFSLSNVLLNEQEVPLPQLDRVLLKNHKVLRSDNKRLRSEPKDRHTQRDHSLFSLVHNRKRLPIITKFRPRPAYIPSNGSFIEKQIKYMRKEQKHPRTNENAEIPKRLPTVQPLFNLKNLPIHKATQLATPLRNHCCSYNFCCSPRSSESDSPILPRYSDYLLS